MSSVQEKQRVDRELLSELIESSVNPAFLNMIPAAIDRWFGPPILSSNKRRSSLGMGKVFWQVFGRLPRVFSWKINLPLNEFAFARLLLGRYLSEMSSNNDT